MSDIDRAAALVRQAESELRKILSDAARSGNYASVLRIAGWARALSEMLAPDLRTSPETPIETHRMGGGPKHSASSRATPRRPCRANGGYPRFHKQGGRLVRVAWSKRDKGEYEHKAPFSAFMAASKAIAGKGLDGRVFSTNDVLPLADDDGSEIPSYQVYVAIALLKQAGLLDQHGRQGYSIPDPSRFLDAAQAVLQSLPEM